MGLARTSDQASNGGSRWRTHGAPQPPIAVKLLALPIVGVVLLIAHGNITFDHSFSSESSAPSSKEPRSPVREVFAVIDAATADPDDLDNAQINALVEHVQTTRNGTSTRILQRELPGLARRLDRKIEAMHGRVARSRVITAVGVKCRAATLRFLGRQRLVFRAFARQVAFRGATPRSVDRFSSRVARLSAWYSGQIRSCAAGAAPADRAAIVATVTG